MKNIFRSRPAQTGLAILALFNFANVGVMAQGASRAYFANDPVGRNVVSILSEAPLETMLTTSGQIEADIKINPNNVLDAPKARFLIPVASLDTGIKLRNEHMMEAEWLDAAKYPNIIFTLTKPLEAKTQAATPGAKGAMPVEGELEFHGVKKTVRANVEVEVIGESEATKARLAGEMLHIRASFPLKLDDFGVMIPEMARLKVANMQDVKVDVFVSTGSKAPKWAAPIAKIAPDTGVVLNRSMMARSPFGPIAESNKGAKIRFGTGPSGPFMETDNNGVKTRFGIGPTF